MRSRSWCHNYLLLISLCFLLQMTLTITEISKENHASRVVKIVNHASPCQAKSLLTRLIWARSHITRHGKPLCHPKNVCVTGHVVWPLKRSPIRYSNHRVSLIVAWDQSLFCLFPYCGAEPGAGCCDRVLQVNTQTNFYKSYCLSLATS